MRQLRKFLSLTQRDRSLVVKSTFLLGAIKLGLWLLPFQTLRRILKIIGKPAAELQEAEKTFVDKAVWAVLVATRYIPGIKCLAQALAIQVLLVQRGYPAYLRIGVIKGEGKLSAHAWVETEGQVVGGLANPSRYALLPPL